LTTSDECGTAIKINVHIGMTGMGPDGSHANAISSPPWCESPAVNR
jgi:hypothetical protein